MRSLAAAAAIAIERYLRYASNCMSPRIAPAERAPAPAPVLAKAALAAAERLDLNGRELAEIIGTSEASVSRLKSGRGLDPQRKEGELALLFLRLYRSLDTLVGGDEAKARDWLHAMNDHLGGIPADRIRTVEGLVDVVQYLDAMRGRL
jgi:transcriptional regulator with XRE-family HTH domain